MSRRCSRLARDALPTFVRALPGLSTCILLAGNDAPVDVELREPIGRRQVIDGTTVLPTHSTSRGERYLSPE